jgi:cell wall-associated NlpC family hydrolase
MKCIECTQGIIVYFDSVQVQHLCKSVSTQVGIEIPAPEATIDMIYTPELDREYDPDNDSFAIDQETGHYKDAIENMTNCKIFSLNTFSGKYHLIFDGCIRRKSYSSSGGSKSLIFTAVAHAEGMLRMMAPISMPGIGTGYESIYDFQLRGKGIDTSKIAGLKSLAELNFMDMTLEEIVGTILSSALKYNMIYNDVEGVMLWNNIHKRIKLMGEIDASLFKSDILDLTLSFDKLQSETIYAALSYILSKLSFEFFQDGDGVIKIKPPYWNQPITVDHIIDPSIITSFFSGISHDRSYSRILSVGGKTTTDENIDDSNVTFGMHQPIGVFNGVYWTDALNAADQIDRTVDAYGGRYLPGKTGINRIDDEYTMTKPWSLRTNAVEWTSKSADDAVARYFCHYGHKGVITAIGPASKSSEIVILDTLSKKFAEGALHFWYGDFVEIELTEGPYKGWRIRYYGILSEKYGVDFISGETFTRESNIGKEVRNGDRIGTLCKDSAGRYKFYISLRSPDYVQYSKNTGIPEEKWTTDLVLSDSIVKTVDPIYYFRDYDSKRNFITYFDVRSQNINQIMAPTEYEKKHGMSCYEAHQPLIKVNNVEAFAQMRDANDVLKTYTMFMHKLVNSSARVAACSLIGAPWIRPGMNVWIDPSGRDEIYYVHSVVHRWRADSSLSSTEIQLTNGRSSEAFFSGSNYAFGALNTRRNDNIFVSKTLVSASDYNNVIENEAQRRKVIVDSVNFKQKTNGMIKAHESLYLTSLYGQGAAKDYLSAEGANIKFDIPAEDIASEITIPTRFSADKTYATAGEAIAAAADYLYRKGCGYVWGAQGEILTNSRLEKLKRTYNTDGTDHYELGGGVSASKWIGRQVFDCSGFVCYILSDMTEIGIGLRPEGYDATADGLVQSNNAFRVSPLDLRPGDLLVRSLKGGSEYYVHVGIYCGDYTVIEAKSTKEGVVKRNFKNQVKDLGGDLEVFLGMAGFTAAYRLRTDSYTPVSIRTQIERSRTSPSIVSFNEISAAKTLADTLFTLSYTRNEIQDKMNKIYSECPAVVSERNDRLKKILDIVHKNIGKYYVMSGNFLPDMISRQYQTIG